MRCDSVLKSRKSVVPTVLGTTAVFLAALMLFAAAAFALDFPALTGRVVDEANIIDAGTRAQLTQKLADLESKSTDQLVVVTLRSLQGTSIEDFGVQLGRTWQIGQRGKNNGVLLIVAPNERKVRIEVGYGLEGTLTDAISKLIIENSITPRFRANDYPGGISRGVDDIIQVLTGDADEWKQRAAQRSEPEPISLPQGFMMLVFFGVAGMIIFGTVNGFLQVLHAILIGLGVAQRRPKQGFWYWVDTLPTVAGGSSGSSSGGSSWSGSSGGGFSGGGGSFGGGGSSGSW
jgi:uncharacterized protein